MKIIVASENPVKKKAVLTGFEKMFSGESFEVEGVSVPSGVGDQPHGDEETFRGARNRAEKASREHPGADYYVGIEGGVEERDSELGVTAWVTVKSRDGEWGKGKTSMFFLPPRVAELVREGKELGDADDIVFGRTNSKQQNGAVGLLTDNAVERAEYYREAVVFALIPFKNRKLYRLG